MSDQLQLPAGPELDSLVAQACGIRGEITRQRGHGFAEFVWEIEGAFSPSTSADDAIRCATIVAKEIECDLRITIYVDGEIEAEFENGANGRGDTLALALCRAILRCDR